MKKILFIATLLSTLSVSSQQVDWSPLMKSAGRGTLIMPVKGKDFFTTVVSGVSVFANLQLKYYDNFESKSKEKIEVKTPDGSGWVADYLIIDGKFVAFIADEKAGVKKMYYQVYGTDCLPEGELVLISKYNVPKGWKREHYFNVLQSVNREFFVIEYSIPGKREDVDRFGYKVLNSEFETVNEGEFDSPYSAAESQYSNRYISNTGDYFLGLKVYNTNEKGKVKDWTSIKKFFLYAITGSEIDEVEIDFDGKKITDLSLSSDQSKLLTCTGLYGDAEGRGTNLTKGVCYFQVNFKSKKITNEGFSEFTKEFITQDFTEKAKAKADKNEAKGKGAPQLYSYDFRMHETTADGGIIVVMEQYYVRVVTTTNSKGQTSTTYYYHYNDIIAYRVQADGKFDWINKVNKRQVSANDGGYFSSVGGYLDKDKLVLFFNDNNKNYEENGKFIKPAQGKSIISSSMRKKTNCVSKLEIDLKTGEVERERYTSREETSALAVPKLFTADYVNNEMFMYFITGSKEKFGILSF